MFGRVLIVIPPRHKCDPKMRNFVHDDGVLDHTEEAIALFRLSDVAAIREKEGDKYSSQKHLVAESKRHCNSDKIQNRQRN